MPGHATEEKNTPDLEEALFAILRQRGAAVAPRALARMARQMTGAQSYQALHVLRTMIGDGRLQMTAQRRVAPLGRVTRAGDPSLSLSLCRQRRPDAFAGCFHPAIFH